MSIELESYREINESHDTTLAYHLGSRSGFFAEYVNMLQAIVYCLQQRIQFQLYSKDANFATNRGWSDFFEPFCKELKSPLHRVFNPRFPTPKFRFKLRKAAAPLVKKICCCDYLSYEVWDGINENRFNNSSTELRALGIHAPAIEIFRDTSSMVWCLKPAIKQQIDAIRETLQLPEKYGALHIRSGDKIKEALPYPPSAYIDKLTRLIDTKDIFVLTDDYNNFRQFVEKYPELHFHTLEKDSQSGYRHRANKRRPREEKRLDYLSFLAGMETARQACAYVGTFSSNVNTFLRLSMPTDRCHAVDVDHTL